MSAKDPNLRYDTPVQVAEFHTLMMMRKHLHTMIPAYVMEYDAATKRARLQPAIMRASYDGSEPPKERAQLLNVPVVSEATGGYMVHTPLKRGDLVMVLFSERGLQKFKDTRLTEISVPTKGRFFDQMDGVAIKWGVEGIEPVDPDAICLQSENGNAYITLKDDEIVLKVGDKGVRITGDKVRLGRV